MTASRRSNENAQADLFDARPALPEGFRFEAEVISPAEEQSLLSQVRELPLNRFEFRGYEGKRRVTSFGWRYDFEQQSLEPTEEIPQFLLPLREIAARFASLDPAELQQRSSPSTRPEQRSGGIATAKYSVTWSESRWLPPARSGSGGRWVIAGSGRRSRPCSAQPI